MGEPLTAAAADGVVCRKYSCSWQELGAHAHDSVVWEEYAWYLCNKTELAAGTIVEYLRKAAWGLREFDGNEFFKFLDQETSVGSSYPEGHLDVWLVLQWFHDMVRQCEVDKWKEAVANNDVLSKQAEPIYLNDRRSISRAFRAEGSAESQLRFLALQ